MTLLEEFIEFNRAAWHGSSESLVRTQAGFFFKRFKSLRAEEVTAAHVALWLDESVKAGVHPNTLRIRLKWVKRAFRWALLQGKIKINPVQTELLPNIRAAKVVRMAFSYEQCKTLLRVAATAMHLQRKNDNRFSEFWPSAIRIAWHTGLRISDVAELQWKNVNLKDEAIVAYPRKKFAVRERLLIPMEPELLDHMRLLWELRPVDDAVDAPWVLPVMARSYRDTRNRLGGEFRALCKRAGIPDSYSFHSFRHAFVTRLLNAGVHPMIISSMTGQSLEQVQAYAHLSYEAKLDALRQSREFMLKTRQDETLNALALPAITTEKP